MGAKFQCIGYNKSGNYEGWINCTTGVKDADFPESALIYWLVGAEASCQVNRTVGSEFYVLKDINSLTSFTKAKNKNFRLNQVMRVLDQWGNDVAVLFGKYYMDKEQNLAPGRTNFWNDIVDYSQKLEGIRAINTFDTDSLKVEQGEEKESVAVTVTINPAVAMEKCYMYCYVA